jgi:hypothetical protein
VLGELLTHFDEPLIHSVSEREAIGHVPVAWEVEAGQASVARHHREVTRGDAITR